MSKTIKFIIAENGETKIEVSGVVGEGCKDLTRDFETILGGTTYCELRPSYFELNQEDNLEQH